MTSSLQRQTDSSNCYSTFSSLQLLINYNNAYFLLETHTSNPLINYANNEQFYKLNRKIIELYFIQTQLQIKYQSENNEKGEVF